MRETKTVKVILLIEDDKGRVFMTKNTIVRGIRTPEDSFCVKNAFMNGIRDNLQFFINELDGYSTTWTWRIRKTNKFYKFINVILRLLEEKEK